MYIVNNNKKIKLEYANTFKKKLIGFSFKKDIDFAYRFKCKSIHTFFMREKIDICITDKNNNILKLIPNLNKKILIYKKAYYIYELPNNSIKKLKLKENNKLLIQK